MKIMIPDPTGAGLASIEGQPLGSDPDAKPQRFSPASLQSDAPLKVSPQKRQGAPTIVVPAEERDAMLVDLAALRQACG